LDSKKSPVLGSLIVRKKQPKEGGFAEVHFVKCGCVLSDSAVAGGTNLVVTINSDKGVLVSVNTGTANAQTAATFLNTALAGFGTFEGVAATNTIILKDLELGGIKSIEVTRA
jgi:hypothetical protein